MFKHYLKIAFRSLVRKKGYSFINIAGLAVGIACCLAIFQFVAFEYSIDRFHENRQDIYAVISTGSIGGEDRGAGGAYTPQAMGPAVAEVIPEIRHYTRVHPESPVVSNPAVTDRVFEEEDVLYVDPAFLDMFTYPLVQGSQDNALEPGTVLISRSAAARYFGDSDPLGQALNVAGSTNRSYNVSGILQDLPANSRLQFNMLLPMDNLLREGQYANEPDNGWSWNNFSTYIQLHPGADPVNVGRKMTDVYLTHAGELLQSRGIEARLYAQPLRDIYLNNEVKTFIGKTGSYRTVYFFIVIAIVTLLIALVNYVNLATARALDRTREVGVRKVNGADRRQLIYQFFLESALTNLAAFTIALVLVELLHPAISSIWGVQLIESIWTNPWLPGAFLGTFLISTFLAGLYPALILSSFKPVSVLKGKIGSSISQLWMRRGLVIIQFTAAVVLIGGTVVVYNQLSFMRNMDLGLDLEQVITIPGPRLMPEGTDLAASRTTFVDELRRQSDVRQAATSWALPGRGFNWNGISIWRAEHNINESIRSEVSFIDTSFVSLYELQVIAGRGFDVTSSPFGSVSPSEVLVNESTVRSLGFASADEALGHALRLASGYDVLIAGVLKDFNWSSAHSPRENIIFGYASSGTHISVRVDVSNLPATIATIQSIYNEMFPGNVFRYDFADETFAALYMDDQKFATLFALFAGLAIAIACLGLFGLASFTAQQRTKEIGIRKVLGASVASLFAMLTRDFLKLVVVAVVIALPVSYWLMQRWLEDFAFRINIGVDLLLLVPLIVIIIAFVSVAFQSVQAALMNPVNSLKNE